MNDAQNAFRAGLVIVVGIGLGLFFFFRSVKTSLDSSNSVPHYAYLTDASGINPKSLITIAGLQVGEIKNATLVPVKLKELIFDLEPRMLAKYGFLDDDEAPDANADFDAIIDSFIKRGRLPPVDEPEEPKAKDGEAPKEEAPKPVRAKLTRAEIDAAIAKLKEDEIVVAKIDFNIGRDWPLSEDTWMKKDSLGVLGANALFLEPGVSPKKLEPGARLQNVRSLTPGATLLQQAEGIVASIRSIVKDIESIADDLDENVGGIVKDVNKLTTEISRFVGEEGGEGERLPPGGAARIMRQVESIAKQIDTVAKALNKDGGFEGVVANLRKITNDIADLTGKGTGSPGPDGGPEGDGDIRATMASVRKVTDDLSVVTDQIKTALGGNEEEIGEGVKKLNETITELNRSLSSLSEVAGRVERGEGTVGRLLTDEKTADKVEAAIAGASDFVTSLTSLETHVDIGSWYNVNRGAATTTVGLKLQPKPDKFYLIEVIDDDGAVERIRDREVTPEGEVIRESVREDDNQLRISAMFAKRFFDFLVLRVGLIETTGGVGANVFLLDNRLELRSDLFNLSLPRDAITGDAIPDNYLPRWRTLIKAQPIPHFYVSAGVDDVLNTFGPRGYQPYSQQLGFGFDYFFGIGLTFKDEDLRSILPFIPGG